MPTSQYSLPVPDAARLADLTGIRSDLTQVVGYCDRMIDRYAGAHLKKDPFDIVGFTTSVDFIDWSALSSAACISYGRCFGAGVRQSLLHGRSSRRLLALLRADDAELRTVHEFVLMLRNKHIAHSVNAFEENVVTVHIDDAFQSSTEIDTVSARNTSIAGLGFDVPAKLKRLAEWWLNKVDDEIGAERARLLSIVRGTPLADLKANGVPPPQHRGDVGTDRASVVTTRIRRR